MASLLAGGQVWHHHRHADGGAQPAGRTVSPVASSSSRSARCATASAPIVGGGRDDFHVVGRF
jgi:hypothetical protein